MAGERKHGSLVEDGLGRVPGGGRGRAHMGKVNRHSWEEATAMRVVAAHRLSWFAREQERSWDMGFSGAGRETVLSPLGWLVTLGRERAGTFRVERTWI